jgi:hypothetical protein
MKGTFLALDPKSEIFENLKSLNPKWWNLFRNDKELYIDIRKDNYINVYYLGASVAEIKFKRDFIAKTHQKYLGDIKSRGKTKNGKEKFEYDRIDLNVFDATKLNEIKKQIKSHYSKRNSSEHPSEKSIQGKMITANSNYIDSEFQFNQDSEIDNLRIDLIELSNCSISFVELKGISDSRLRSDVNRNSVLPEIIEQMEKYQLFINKYEKAILNYYKTFLEIKKSLGLTTINCSNLTLNKNPKLIIVDTYTKVTLGRTNRIKDIENLLKVNKIDYEIRK